MDDAHSPPHPDEGTIHAWLDGALDGASAQALAAHVASCAACAERVAEARGLIAGASRIVSALDDAPSVAAPAWGQKPAAATSVPVRTGDRSAWRLLRVTPGRAAIAATLLVALGVTLTYRRAAIEPDATRAAVAVREQAPAAPAPAPAHDALLDSAVARNVAKSQPPRTVEAAPGPAIPSPEAPPGPAKVPDNAAPLRVAVGRAALKAQAESGAGVAPDRLMDHVSEPVMARAGATQSVAAAVRADSVARGPVGPVVAGAAPAPAAAVARARVLAVAPVRECYRVESANGAAATWGTVPLPLVVALDSSRRHARVLTVAGQDAGTRAAVTLAADDSLVFRLQRIGYEGTLALGAPGDARAGVMRSRPSTAMLSETVVTATGADEAPTDRRARARVPVAKSVPPASAAPSAAAQADARSAANAAPAVPVVARRISCP